MWGGKVASRRGCPGFHGLSHAQSNWAAHWTRIYPTNVLERLNKEVKRRTKVVEIFPDIPSVLRLVGALLVEADDEWQVRRRYFSKDSMRQLYAPDFSDVTEPTLLRLAPVR